MADRRTLEELKLLLALSRAAEEKFLVEVVEPQIGWTRGASRFTREVEESIRKRFPKPKSDPARGIVGAGSTRDYTLAYPEAAKEYEAAERREIKAQEKAQTIRSAPERGNKKNPFLRHRRKLVADQLRQFRESLEGSIPGSGRQAGKFEILRLLQERGSQTHNPIQAVADAIRNLPFVEQQAFDEAFYGQPDPEYFFSEEYKEAKKARKKKSYAEIQAEDHEHAAWAEKHAKEVADERRTLLEKKFFEQKAQVTPRRLRRMTDKDLDNLIATKFRDPRIIALLLEEKRLRLADEFNRNLSRRIMVGKIGKGVAKPSSLLTSKVPTGSGGENAARFALRILTRGRSR